jgi:hypothetical protein
MAIPSIPAIRWLRSSLNGVSPYNHENATEQARAFKRAPFSNCGPPVNSFLDESGGQDHSHRAAEQLGELHAS